MTRALGGPRAGSLALVAPPPAPGVVRIAVVLEDLAGDDGRALGTAIVDLPPGRAGVLVELRGAGPGVAARLLQGCADHLRALGRRRLAATCPAGARTELAAYEAAGFRPVRREAG